VGEVLQATHSSLWCTSQVEAAQLQDALGDILKTEGCSAHHELLKAIGDLATAHCKDMYLLMAQRCLVRRSDGEGRFTGFAYAEGHRSSPEEPFSKVFIDTLVPGTTLNEPVTVELRRDAIDLQERVLSELEFLPAARIGIVGNTKIMPYSQLLSNLTFPARGYLHKDRPRFVEIARQAMPTDQLQSTLDAQYKQLYA
jgi:hypothetical protein